MRNNILIVGAGKGGTALLELLSQTPAVYIVGITDTNADASGMKLAQSLGIATSVDFKTFLSNPGLNQVIDVTGSEHVRRELAQYTPAGVEIIGGHSARLMWEIVETYKKSKEYIELLIEMNPSVMFTVDTNRCITGWNKRAGELTGYAKSEVIGKPCFMFAEFPCKEHCDLFSPGEPQQPMSGRECTIKRKDGKFRIVSRNAELLRDSAGAVIGGIEIFEDITERKNMEVDLRSSRQHLMETLNFLPDPTFVIDKGGMVIVWNKGMEDLTGVPARDMIGKGDYEYALPFYGERRPILVDLALHNDLEIEKRYSNLTREGNLLVGDAYISMPFTGKTRFLWGAATALFDSDGNTIGAIETIRDITDRRKIEDALRESEEKYRAFFETSQDSIFITSPEGRPLDCNDAAVKLLGYENRDEFMKVSISDIYEHPVEREKHIGLIMRDGFCKDYAVNLRRKDGSIINTVVTSTVRKDKEGRVNGFQGTIHDMTAYKRAEEGLKKSHERFQVVMDSLDALVYVADLETYELLFINKFGMERWGTVVGRLCWQTLRKGQEGPCPFCTNDKLADAQGNPTGVLVWESQRSPDGKWYQCQDQAIRWIDGRLVRLEVAIEITEQRRMQVQLHDKIHDLERFQKVMVGRELKMRELKSKILELEKSLEKR
jgi:PAS domain S-box-containing protein